MKKTKVLVLFAAVTAMTLATNGEVVPTVLPPEVQKTPWLHVDASNASTLETEVNPDTGVVSVKGAKDASGGSRFITSVGNPTLGNYLSGYLGTHFFDCGPFVYGTTNAGFSWSETCSMVRDVFLVVADNIGQPRGSSFFIGSENEYDFHRGEGGVLFSGDYASEFIKKGVVELDGAGFSVSGVFPAGFHLLHIQTTGNVTADRFAVDRDVRTGGISLAEAVVFDQVLTPEEAMAMTDYLIYKWFAKVDSLCVECSRNLPDTKGVDLGCGTHTGLNAGDKLSLTIPSAWTNLTEKFVANCMGWKLCDKDGNCLTNGSGNVFNYEHPTPASERKLIWQVVAWPIGTGPQPAADTAFHVDASNAKTLTTDGNGRVLNWADGSWGRNFAANNSVATSPVVGECNGQPFVDFGQLTYSASAGLYLNWNVRDYSIREVYWVFADSPEGDKAFLLGDDATTHFHRGENGELFSDKWASAYVLGGVIQVDGRTVGPEFVLPGGFHVIRVQTSNAVAAGTFARDRSSRFGGGRLAEVLVYDRMLSSGESDETTAYLMSKWSQLGSWDNAVLANEEAVALCGGGESTKTIYVSRDGVYKLKFTCSGEDEESGQTIAFSVDNGASKTVEVRGVDIKKVSNAFELKAGVHKFHLKNASPNPGRKVNFEGFELRGVKAGLAIFLG